MNLNRLIAHSHWQGEGWGGIFLGSLFALAIAGAAYRTRALTSGGAVSAFVMGALVFGLGRWPAAAALIAFFATSSALSRWRKARKEKLGFAKPGARDAAQVWANGGVALACLVTPLLFHKASPSAWHLFFLGSLAAANADTWATEIGSAAGGRTWDLRTGRPARTGASGAISLPGCVAAAGGALLIALFAIRAGPRAVAAVAGGGFAGAFVDSVFGATVQAHWKDSESPQDSSDASRLSSKPDRGVSFIQNDMVNVFCTLTGAVITALALCDRF